MKRHTVTINGRMTAISLEDEFWADLRIIANAQGKHVNALVQEIAAARPQGTNLSSRVRLAILAHWRDRGAAAGVNERD